MRLATTHPFRVSNRAGNSLLQPKLGAEEERLHGNDSKHERPSKNHMCERNLIPAAEKGQLPGHGRELHRDLPQSGAETKLCPGENERDREAEPKRTKSDQSRERDDTWSLLCCQSVVEPEERLQINNIAVQDLEPAVRSLKYFYLSPSAILSKISC